MGTSDPFFTRLQAEMLIRARLVTAGQRARTGALLPQDLVQEALAKMLAAYGEQGLRERSEANVMALAWRTMRNIAIDEGRRKKPLLAGGGADDEDDDRPDPSPPDPGPLQDERLDTEHRAAKLRKSLDALQPHERQFLLEVIERDSVPAAQAAVGWPPASPYYHLRRLLKQVRESLGNGLEVLSREG